MFAWRAVRHVQPTRVVLARNAAAGRRRSGRRPVAVVATEIALHRAARAGQDASCRLRRLLPVRGWHPAGGAERGVTAIIQPGGSRPRRDGHRGRRPPPYGDGLHRRSPLPPLMESRLALEMVRITEAAAIDSARLMGRGDRTGRTAPRSRRCARTMDESRDGRHDRHRRGRARRGAHALHRRAGRPAACPDSPRSTSRSTRSRAPTWCATGQANAITRPGRVRAGAACSTRPDTYLEKLCVGPVVGRPGRSSDCTVARTSAASPSALRRQVTDITVVILDRPRHETLIDEIRDGGRAHQAHRRRRPLGGASACAVSGTGVHAVMGIGGAPEGVLTAAALRCLGGEIQARFRCRNDEERERAPRMGARRRQERVYATEDLAPGDEPRLRATGVTDGDLLQGVRFFGGGARTHSLVDELSGPSRSASSTTVHMFDRRSAAVGATLAPARA